GLETQLADACRTAQLQAVGALEQQACPDRVAAVDLDQFIDETAHLARVATGFGRALLAVVELLDDLPGQEYALFLEPEQRGGIVHQDVGVEHVDALAVVHHRNVRLLARERRARPRAVATCGAGRRSVRSAGGVTCAALPSARRARPGHGRRP